MPDRLSVTLLVGPTIPVPAPRAIVDALTGIEVQTGTQQRSGFQLTLTLAKGSDLSRVMLPAGYFDPGIRVVIVATINGIPTVLTDGVVTQQQVAPSNEPGTGTLTVRGEDLLVLLDLEERVRAYPAVPDFSRIPLILLEYVRYGIAPVVVPPISTDVKLPTTGFDTQRTRDLAYINELARQAGYVFYLIPGPVPLTSVAYWGPEVRVGVPQPALNIDMDHATNVESLSFSFNGLSAKRVGVEIQEPNTKLSISVPLPNVSLLKPPLALKPAPALRFEKLSGVAKQSAVRALLLGLAELAGAADAVTGSGQLDVLRYGRPLRARELVGVRGAGTSYDGLYYVTSVTHSIKRGTYTQSFNLSRDGLVSTTPRVPV